MTPELWTQLETLLQHNQVSYNYRYEQQREKIKLTEELVKMNYAKFVAETGAGGSVQMFKITHVGKEALAAHLGKTIAEIEPKTLVQIAAETDMSDESWKTLARIKDNKGEVSLFHADPGTLSPHETYIQQQVLIAKGYATAIKIGSGKYTFRITDAGRKALAE